MISALLELWYLWLLVLLIFIYSLFKPKINGIIGEKAVSIILSRLDSQKYKVINDVIVRVNGKTSQIDHLVISNYGIFVIETKNYKGWIVGDEKSEYWTQVIYSRKEKLYNPLRQNYGHVQALKNTLVDYPSIPYIPIVVFSINADLKVKTSSHVVYSVNLLKTIKRYKEEVITDSQKEEIHSIMLSSNVNDKATRKEHVKAIHTNITRRQTRPL